MHALHGRPQVVPIRRVLGVSQFSANRIAKRFIAEGWLKSEGSKRGRRYIPVS